MSVHCIAWLCGGTSSAKHDPHQQRISERLAPQLGRSTDPAAVITEALPAGTPGPVTIDLPGLAEFAATASVGRSFALVMHLEELLKRLLVAIVALPVTQHLRYSRTPAT